MEYVKPLKVTVHAERAESDLEFVLVTPITQCTLIIMANSGPSNESDPLERYARTFSVNK